MYFRSVKLQKVLQLFYKMINNNKIILNILIIYKKLSQMVFLIIHIFIYLYI